MIEAPPSEWLALVAEQPHLIGHLVGKTKLTELHSKWIWEVWGPEEHTALQAHRGAYKTTAVTEIGCIWWLLFHPSDRIALVRETWTEANNTLQTIVKYMQSEPIRALFYLAFGIEVKAVTKKDGKVVFNFKGTITKEGSIDAYSIENIPTGSHYDKILCDDIITINSRLSKAKRERVKQGLYEIITNIIDPGKQVMVVGTPWHPDDAWNLKGESGERVLPVPTKYTCYETGVLSPQEIAKKKSLTTSSLFAANYELRHQADKDMIFQDPKRGEWNRNLRPVVAHLDAKFSGNHYNGFTLMAKDPKTGLIQVQGFSFNEHVEEKVDWIVQQCQLYGVSTLYIETNADKGYTGKLIGSKKIGNYRVNVQNYNERMNKHIKIVSYLKHYFGNLVYAHTCDTDYMVQILDYREGEEPDDAPDSAASLLRERFYPQDPESLSNAALYQD